MTNQKTYPIRCWSHERQEVYIAECTYGDIIYAADEMQMNMVDVGLVLLNEERRKLGVPELTKENIADSEFR